MSLFQEFTEEFLWAVISGEVPEFFDKHSLKFVTPSNNPEVVTIALATKEVMELYIKSDTNDEGLKDLAGHSQNFFRDVGRIQKNNQDVKIMQWVIDIYDKASRKVGGANMTKDALASDSSGG